MAGNFANACCQALQFESSAIRAANFGGLTLKGNDLTRLGMFCREKKHDLVSYEQRKSCKPFNYWVFKGERRISAKPICVMPIENRLRSAVPS